MDQFLGLLLSRNIEENPDHHENSEENSIRVCQYCMNLLSSRESMQASRNCNPVVTQLYDQLRLYLKDLEKDVDMYYEMSLSLK